VRIGGEVDALYGGAAYLTEISNILAGIGKELESANPSSSLKPLSLLNYYRG
jgi:hypothetical protein